MEAAVLQLNLWSVARLSAFIFPYEEWAYNAQQRTTNWHEQRDQSGADRLS